MTTFLSTMTAFLLHKLGNGLIALALGVQRLAFRAEFGSDWRAARQRHYRSKITQIHFNNSSMKASPNDT
jgi:hypothetical protein